MFRISDLTGNTKIHYCSSLELAMKISEDLKERYESNCVIDSIEEMEYILDPGGSMWIDDMFFTFCLNSDVTIKCKSQHWDYLKTNIDNFGKKKFYKLYGYLGIYCFTDEEKEQFLRLFNVGKKKYEEFAVHTKFYLDVAMSGLNKNSNDIN